MIENARFDDDFPFFVYKMYTQCNRKIHYPKAPAMGNRQTLSVRVFEYLVGRNYEAFL